MSGVGERAAEEGLGHQSACFIGLALGVPSPIFLWYYGARLRAKSPDAADVE